MFTLDIAKATTSKTITTQSSDVTKAATYPLTVTVKYEDYPSIIQTANFNIVVVDPCTVAEGLKIDAIDLPAADPYFYSGETIKL